MMETGKDMQAKYRETGLGGLANVCAILKAKCNVQGGRDW
jgi:L-serine dehydratase